MSAVIIDFCGQRRVTLVVVAVGSELQSNSPCVHTSQF